MNYISLTNQKITPELGAWVSTKMNCPSFLPGSCCGFEHPGKHDHTWYVWYLLGLREPFRPSAPLGQQCCAALHEASSIHGQGPRLPCWRHSSAAGQVAPSFAMVLQKARGLSRSQKPNAPLELSGLASFWRVRWRISQDPVIYVRLINNSNISTSLIKWILNECESSKTHTERMAIRKRGAVAISGFCWKSKTASQKVRRSGVILQINTGWEPLLTYININKTSPKCIGKCSQNMHPM